MSTYYAQAMHRQGEAMQKKNSRWAEKLSLVEKPWTPSNLRPWGAASSSSKN